MKKLFLLIILISTYKTSSRCPCYSPTKKTPRPNNVITTTNKPKNYNDISKQLVIIKSKMSKLDLKSLPKNKRHLFRKIREFINVLNISKVAQMLKNK